MIALSEYLERGLQIKIGNKVAEQINGSAVLSEFPRKQIVLLEGTKSETIYFIISGIVRGYYIDENGNDITKCFSRENQFFSSEGLRTESTSSFTIECLEDCRCIQLPYKLVREVMKADEVLHEVFVRYYLREVANLEKHIKSAALMDAEERYIAFCRQYPDLQERVDLQYIASYIGIRAASLSRIRKKLKNAG
jgi:cAMP-binding proteins - catabolite gene activator and regulatory subunit of cAMP-dependent protein kinases